MSNRARSVAVLGTGSDVGKSLVAAGLCRLLFRTGVRVAPFKAQNMSLNSFVTVDGGEIGRAQALQAQACGITAHVDMNPILLKPESDEGSQVIVQGKVLGKFGARGYFLQRAELFRYVCESYERLAKEYEVVVIEGAGSAAEVNLRDRDLANWPVVELANASAILVADIDRGGVFAQIIGTIDLLAPEERRRLIGIVVNKFRGDVRLFADGVAYLESRTRLPVFGTLPFLRDLDMDQEDSVQIERHRHTAFTPQHVNVAVILLPRMSNFTDFNILAAEHDVVLRYASSSLDIAGADVVILPGSKNTIADLDHVYTHGFVESLKRHVERGGEVVGICGGYQMLGCSISDPHATEAGGCMQGLGFLDIDTELLTQKTTIQVEATPLLLNGEMLGSVSGYQIHMGVTERHSGQPCFQIRRAVGRVVKEDDMDGAAREDGLVWGTYIHGVFDQPEFRRAWLNRLRQRKGLPPLNTEVSELVSQRRESELDRWADHMQKHLDLNPLRETLRLG